MAEPKTRPTGSSFSAFLRTVADEDRRRDCLAVVKIMTEATRAEPRMWGPSIVGFGTYHYKYASGREGDWPLTSFSPRKNDLTLYIMGGFGRYEPLMSRLGKYKNGKACLYIKKLADIDLAVLKELVKASVEHVARSHSSGRA